VVGTAADTHITPRSCSNGYLRTYSFSEDGTGLELLHKVRLEAELPGLCSCNFGYQTEVDDVPLALLAFQGRLAAGVGKALRLYDIGKKLLRKVENKVSLSIQIIFLD
jgi:splicing factor 3B subunit 3